jgi:hypothetical protein
MYASSGAARINLTQGHFSTYLHHLQVKMVNFHDPEVIAEEGGASTALVFCSWGGK